RPHRRTPTATLVPYTTLFRSIREKEFGLCNRLTLQFGQGFQCRKKLEGNIRRTAQKTLQILVQNLDGLLEGIYSLFRRSNGLFLDRKSTRLNSSHVIISYAVF